MKQSDLIESLSRFDLELPDDELIDEITEGVTQAIGRYLVQEYSQRRNDEHKNNSLQSPTP